MMIAMLKPDNEYFVLKNIEEPLKHGWRVSNCGKVAISLSTNYYCDGFSITESPHDIFPDPTYQLFGCMGDVYVYVNDIKIHSGDLHHSFYFGIESFKLIPPDVMVNIINNLNVAGVSL